MKSKDLAKYLDLANHHPDAKPEDIRILCQQVKKHGLNSAFVNPFYVALAKECLVKQKVGTVVAFPVGQEIKDVKVLAAIQAVKSGADELDVSLNIGLFKAGKVKEVLKESQTVVAAAKNIRQAIIVKLIIETGFLTDDEIKKASRLVVDSGADFVKTCSGWGPRGARIKDVDLIRAAIGSQVKVKVAGGIKTQAQAIEFIKAGADQIGTSKAVEIIKGIKPKAKGGEGE